MGTQSEREEDVRKEVVRWRLRELRRIHSEARQLGVEVVFVSIRGPVEKKRVAALSMVRALVEQHELENVVTIGEGA